MTNRQLIGYGILASPFVAIFIYVAARDGILTASGLFAAVAILVGVIFLGVEMTL